MEHFLVLLIPGLVLVLIISWFVHLARHGLEPPKQANPNAIPVFKFPLTFFLSRGVEGIDTFKPNYRTLIELQDDEIRFSECKKGAYANNLNSASLQYSQITNVAVVDMSENYFGRTNLKVPSSEIIHTRTYTYCLITYRNKDGEERQLRFRRYLFDGNFDTFLKALQSRIAPPTPTDINL